MDVEELEIVIAAVGVIIGMAEIVINDEDEENRNIIEKVDHFAEITVPRFNDRQFKEHFRILPTTFEIVLGQIHSSIEGLHDVHKGQPELPLEKQVLMTLWCLSNLECFRSVSDRFGVSKSCCWRILYRTCHRLLNLNTKFKVIAFPREAQAVQIMQYFEESCGIPGIIGIIDGSYIKIEKPKEYPNSYINRKGFPAVIFQAICDHKKLFLDVYAGEPGILHDSRVFTKSDIYHRIRNNEVELPNDSHLIGDLAYKLTTTMLVGFKDNGHLTNPQKYYNQQLSKVRVLIENTFGLLKGRFRRLKMLDTKRLDLISLLIVAACILHNICLNNADYYEAIHVEEADNFEDMNNDVEGAEAIAKRNNIVNHLYHNHRNQ